MTSFTRPTPERRPTLRIPSPALLLAGASALARTILHRRAARRLADLPDYLLTDIGLKRDDVHEALSRDWREDPTFQLAMTAAKSRRAS